MEAPYSVRLEAGLAQQLACQGGALLILDLPEGAYFGIDHMAFHCGPRFKGVKMLPPGPHFACYSVPGSVRHGGGMGPVTGFFFNVTAGNDSTESSSGSASSKGSVLVRRYDAAKELLVELPEEEAERYVHGVRRYDFDSGLAPYNLPAWRQWRDLTSCLDARLIDALQPVGGHICTAMEAAAEAQAGSAPGEEGDRPATEAEARLRQQLQEGRAARAAAVMAAQQRGGAMAVDKAPAAAASGGGEGNMEVDSAAAGVGGGGSASGAGAAAAAEAMDQGEGPAAGGERRNTGGGPAGGTDNADGSGCCFYTVLPRLVKQSGLTPAQLTAANLDRTQQLAAAAAVRWGGDAVALVGEMQFAFVAFVFGQSMQGFRQWRSLVTLFLNCEAGPLTSHVPAFAAFLAALRSQLGLALTDAAAAPPPPAARSDADGWLAEPLAGLTTHGSLVEEVVLGGGGRDCFLRHHLATFFEVLREAGPQQLDPRVAAEASELRKLMSTMVGWQFDGLEVLGDEDDEYAPVVVELGGEGGAHGDE